MGPATEAAAKANPKQKFAIVDCSYASACLTGTHEPNINQLVYNTVQDAFLGGYLAAGMTKTGKVATYGGMKFGTVTIFMDGFWDGVQYYNKQHHTNVQVLGWSEPKPERHVRGQLHQHHRGADHRQHVHQRRRRHHLPGGGRRRARLGEGGPDRRPVRQEHRDVLGGHRRLRQRRDLLQVLRHQRGEGHRNAVKGSVLGAPGVAGAAATSAPSPTAGPCWPRTTSGRARSRPRCRAELKAVKQRSSAARSSQPPRAPCSRARGHKYRQLVIVPAAAGDTAESLEGGCGEARTARHHQALRRLVANDPIDLVVQPGEIHALLGENGAGKTTLMNVLYGLSSPTRARSCSTTSRSPSTGPGDAIRRRIGMVHQHFMLIPVFTVAENVMLGPERVQGTTGPLQDSSICVRPATRSSSSPSGSASSRPRCPRRGPAVGVQQRVEIIKALLRDAKVLVLDEPTAVLTPQETDDLFRIMRELRGRAAIVFITHKLREVQAIADTITVIRRGKVVGEAADATSAHRARVADGRPISRAPGAKEPAKPAAWWWTSRT